MFLLAYTILVSRGECLDDQVNNGRPIAFALGWFGRWYSPHNLGKIQHCEGTYHDGRVWMMCNPMRAQVWVLLGQSGECVVNGIGPDNGMPNTFTDGVWAGAERRRIRHNCDSVPNDEGKFKVDITPKVGQPDLEVSASGRTRALRYLRHWRSSKCTAHFPIIAAGDPIFRVYITCDRELKAIVEYNTVPASPTDDGPRSSISFWKNRPTAHEIGHLATRGLWLSSSPIGN